MKGNEPEKAGVRISPLTVCVRAASCVVLLFNLLFSGSAAGDDWYTSWDGTLYGYAERSALNTDSVLNPANRMANIATTGTTGEARFDFRAKSANLLLFARPIVLTREERNDSGTWHSNEAYLSQWQARLRPAPEWSLDAGREVLNWGPAQFRSPSSPFYFDNGRGDPLRELSGMDTVKLAWTPDLKRTFSVARIFDSGHSALQPDPWRNSWLAKWDQRGEDWTTGLALALAQAEGRAAFVGLNVQRTLGDAWLLYGEAGSGTRINALVSPAAVARPFSLQTESPRRTSWLLGAAYTLDSGYSMHAEFLHYGHGYTSAQESAYFARAGNTPANAGMALGYAPPLLGRDYLHLVWQSNLMESSGYWRLMATHSFTDGGNELSGYGEHLLGGQVSLFVLGVLPLGSVRQEFSTLLRYSVTAGLKVALP